MQRVSLQDKRESLQQALLRVIARDGIEQATVRNIAAEANINPAAVSYAFSGKDELMMTLHLALQADVYAVVEGAVQGCTTIEEAITNMAKAYFEHTLRDPDRQRAHMELTLSALARAESREIAKLQYEGYIKQLADAVSKLDCGGISKAEITLIARMGLALMDGVIVQYLSTRNQSACKKTLNLGVDLLLNHCKTLRKKS
ncbi:TetR/AcrR family transcriptional regulator [Escherichia coli]|uniref:TetR/AcrR family transcriptional regulator n=1 Tax=Escherichia coli TaxID=562 RepID=UPI001ABCA6F5|nr:TetR/AcrR family transcriptional regulator [Escherichia coli]